MSNTATSQRSIDLMLNKKFRVSRGPLYKVEICEYGLTLSKAINLARTWVEQGHERVQLSHENYLDRHGNIRCKPWYEWVDGERRDL